MSEIDRIKSLLSEAQDLAGNSPENAVEFWESIQQFAMDSEMQAVYDQIGIDIKIHKEIV